ncbi:Pyruvate/Phosphoenolpyruvate kinase-like domain-containing protein [Aspergillus cavernicola]|uniref:Pyruvate/Phosphoenolpyruvate kinase-like domain-containing protein n=1 Tax=Aspergillus cavernicola TaxID=176166 RepID=A0ABR4IE97_9EURO
MATAFPNNLLTLASQGKVCRTLGIKFITSPEIIYIAHNAGFHALFIDLEHSALSLQTASHLCIAALNASLSPFVRVPAGAGPGTIQRVLDCGAMGVVVPHVDTVEQAQAAVSATKYPPIGKRSITSILPHLGFQKAPIETISTLVNSRLSTVIVMIESPEGVSNIDEIAALEGVDVVLVGTNDLSVELGVAGDFEHEVFVKSMERIAAGVKRAGKILGVAGVYHRGDLLEGYVRGLGARFVVGDVDLGMVARAAGEVVRGLKRIEGGDTDAVN